MITRLIEHDANVSESIYALMLDWDGNRWAKGQHKTEVITAKFKVSDVIRVTPITRRNHGLERVVGFVVGVCLVASVWASWIAYSEAKWQEIERVHHEVLAGNVADIDA